MESENGSNGDEGIESGVREREVAKMRVGRDVVLRFSAMVFSLAAAVVLGVDKETTTVLVTLSPTLPPVNVQVTSKWHYMSTFVFVVVANAISCSYAATSLLLTLSNKDGKKRLLIILLDLAMVALLFSAAGAAFAVGLIGLKGNSHFRWDKRCNDAHKFCDQAIAAMCLSGAATSAFFVLVVLAIINLH